MKKLLLILSINIISFVANAQGVLYDNSFFNIMATNPAFAGARKDFNLDALMGNRFNGTITPQQVSQIFSIDGQVGQKSNGLGLQAFNSTIGNFNTQGVLLDYAYRTSIGESASLALGLRGGFTYLPSFYASTSAGVSQFFPYMGAGALLSGDDFFVSLSQPIILTKDSNIGQFVNQKPLFTSIGYSFEPNDKIMFNPSLQYEINSLNGNSFNVAAKVWFSRKFGFGVTLRQKNESFTYGTASYTKFLGTFELQASKSIRIGLSYDGNPYAGLISTTTSGYGTGSLFQLYFKYISIGERENSNRLKFF